MFNRIKKSDSTSKAKRNDETYQGRKKYRRLCSSNVTSDRTESRRSAALSFSPMFAFVEMRKCLMRQDWISLQRLFPIILNTSTNYDALMWRYAFAIFLHSPKSNYDSLRGFLKSCIGVQDEDAENVLYHLMSIDSAM